MLPDEVDDRLVPQRGAAVHTVQIDGEAVLLDEDNGRLHLLNRTGALVWACFDGRSSIGEIVSDISTEVGVPYPEALDDTLTLTLRLGGEGLLANVAPENADGRDGVDAEPAEDADPRFVREPPCSPCLDQKFRPGRADTTTYRIGEQLIGVRTNDPDLAARLRAILGPHVVTGVDAPSNLSLCVAEDEGRVREFHRLYRGAALAVRTRSLGRLVRATLLHLDAFAPEPPGTARLGGRVLVRDGSAVIVDPRLGFTLERIERRVERLGYRLTDAPGIPLDTDTLEVVLWPPRLELDEAAMAAVQRELPSDEPEIALGSARLPLRRVLVGRPDAGSDWSGARTFMALTRLVAASERADQTELALAERMLEVVDVRAYPNDDDIVLSALRETTGS